MAERSAIAVTSARLRLLGGWHLVVDGEEVALGHREQRLLALLALGERGSRAQVASALWPDSTDERALASLRRAVLQCQRRQPGLLAAGRLTLSLDPVVRADVEDLRRAAALTEQPMADLAAHELLTGLRGDELLPGWYDDWVVEERTRIEQLRVGALERIARHGLEHDDLVLAIEAARSAADIEPLRESVREVAIRAYAGRGDVGGAVGEFQRYETMVRDELGVGPSSRMLALVEPLLVEAEPAPVEPVPLPVPLPVPVQRTAPVEERRAPAETAEERRAPAETAEPLQPDWAPPTMTLADFLDGRTPTVRRAGGVRRAGAALLLVAGLVLAVALGIDLAGPGPSQRATTDPGGGARVVSPDADSEVAPSRTVRVRTVDAAAGSAAFAVRATLRPAQVRLVVRGRAGLRVVRHLVVRDADGRQVVVEGLVPGTYSWSATSHAASPVQGEVSVTPAVVETRTPQAPPSASVTPDVTQVVSTPESTPTQTPSSTPVQTPTQQPTQPPTHSPSPSPSPTGTPTDPGTVAPTPVG